MRYQDHCQHQHARQSEIARQYGVVAPLDPDVRDLASFRLDEGRRNEKTAHMLVSKVYPVNTTYQGECADDVDVV